MAKLSLICRIFLQKSQVTPNNYVIKVFITHNNFTPFFYKANYFLKQNKNPLTLCISCKNLKNNKQYDVINNLKNISKTKGLYI